MVTPKINEVTGNAEYSATAELLSITDAPLDVLTNPSGKKNYSAEVMLNFNGKKVRASAIVPEGNVQRAAEDNTPMEVGKVYSCRIIVTERETPLIVLSHLTGVQTVTLAELGISKTTQNAQKVAVGNAPVAV